MDWQKNAGALTGGLVDIKTVGIIGYESDYGKDWAFGVKAAAANAGVEVAWEYLAPPTEFDVTQQLDY